MKKHLLIVAAFALVSNALVSCDDDDNNKDKSMTSSVISFENVFEPKDLVESGSFVGVGDAVVNKLVVLPGQSINFTFSVAQAKDKH